MCSQNEKQRFLREDFHDSPKELSISAITWQVAVERETGPQRIDFQKDVSMHAAFAQARALYEFYTDDIRQCEDARATHFCREVERLNRTALCAFYGGSSQQAYFSFGLFSRKRVAGAQFTGHERSQRTLCAQWRICSPRSR